MPAGTVVSEIQQIMREHGGCEFRRRGVGGEALDPYLVASFAILRSLASSLKAMEGRQGD